MLSKEHAQRTPRENVCACAGTKNGEHFKLGLNGFNVACVTGSMLEIEPATEVDEYWTVIWMHENNNQSKRRLLIRLSKLI
jgi:hypothetical protein